MRKFSFFIIFYFILNSNSYSRDLFDKDQFVINLNNEIQKNRSGVTVRATNLNQINNGQIWIETIAKTPQDFAVVAMDSKGEPVDIFGSSTPFKEADGIFLVPGYTLPKGGSFKTVGAAGWNEAALQLVARNNTTSVPNESISKAVDTISSATDYIAKELCSKRSRPTKLVLNLNAGFELVFSASTGSEVEWDLEIVCKRIQ